MATTVSMHTFVMPDENHGAKFTDTLDIDQAAHRLYVGDNWAGGVDVFDISTPEPNFLETLRVRGSIYGIVAAPELGKLYVGLLPGTVAVFDVGEGSSTRSTLLTRVDVGGRGHADLVDYDPVHKKIYIANRNDGFLSAIDAETDSVVARIDGLGGGLEQPRFNPGDGMLYLSGNTDNVLYQIDPESDRLVRTIEVGVPCNPNGLAIDPKRNVALLAGSNREHPNTIVIDLTSGVVAGKIEGCGCGDGAIYSATVDRFFFAASGFPETPVLGIFGDDPLRLIAAVESHRRASWVAFDETNEVVYLPSVEAGKTALLSFPLADVPA